MLKEIIQSLDTPGVDAATALHHEGSAAEAVDQPAIAWQPPVLRLNAREGEGIEELHQAVEAHRQWLAALPADHPRRRRRIARELGFVLRSRVSRLVEGALRERIDVLAAEVYGGKTGLWEALEILRAEMHGKL
jgi:putative protein kinase ArgK-like GTPase of G3E family